MEVCETDGTGKLTIEPMFMGNRRAGGPVDFNELEVTRLKI
jgi:hypothetical protein